MNMIGFGLFIGFILDIVIGIITYTKECVPTQVAASLGIGCIPISYYALFLWFSLLGAFVEVLTWESDECD